MSFEMSKMEKCADCKYRGECGNENNIKFEDVIGCWSHPDGDDRRYEPEDEDGDE
jgi:hypothetical protein